MHCPKTECRRRYVLNANVTFLRLRLFRLFFILPLLIVLILVLMVVVQVLNRGRSVGSCVHGKGRCRRFCATDSDWTRAPIGSCSKLNWKAQSVTNHKYEWRQDQKKECERNLMILCHWLGVSDSYWICGLIWTKVEKMFITVTKFKIQKDGKLWKIQEEKYVDWRIWNRAI